jgi:predicted transcriptional regulator/ribosomal protein L37AE/L43A
VFDKINSRIHFNDVGKSKDNNSDSYFHCEICNDSDAALKVYEDGNWKCHSCGATGQDVISYYSQVEDVSQGNAAKELAEQFDIEIKDQEELSEEEKKKRKKQRRVKNCLQDVVEKAQENLSTSKRNNLKEWRNWSTETIQDLKIGWIDETLYNSLKDRWGDLLEKAGIHYGMTDPDHNSDGTYLIPHLRRNGRPYLVTCRHEHSDGKRYEQSKSTEYVENDIFYATGNDSDTLVVTEGYPDSISAYEEGFDSIAAGTGSFNGNQARVTRFAEKNYKQVFVISDNDDTGQENMKEISKSITEYTDLEVKIHQWSDSRPEKYDLDDLTSDNPGELEEYIESAETFLEAFRNYNPSSIDASLINKEISIRGNIKGQKQGQAIPKTVLVTCKDCGEDYTEEFTSKRDLESFLTSKQNQHNLIKSKISEEDCGECGSSEFYWKGLEYFDKAWLQLQDLIEESESFSTNQNNKVPVYVVDDKLPDSKTVKIKGSVHVNQQSDNIFVIGEKIEPEQESFHNIEFSQEEHEEYGKKWEKEKAEQMVDSEMIGRPKSRTALQLVAHSPVRIPTITGKTTRGALRVNFFGDGGTNKSKQVKLLTKNNYRLGGFMNAETGSRTGLLYSINTDKNVIEWGALPLNDMGLLGIDGFNEMNDDELTQMREVMEDLQVEVNRSVQGSAPARTRIIACMNPEKTPMSYEYKNPAKALEQMDQFSGPDYRRWDLFVPFGKDDVDLEEINYRDAAEKPYSEEFYRKHVLWAWNLDPKDILYTDGFSNELKTQSYNLVNSFEFADLQIVSGAFREKLTRLSVAWAVLKHSVTEDGRVKVSSSHVLEVKEFFTDLMSDMGIQDAKEDYEERTTVDEEEVRDLVEELGEDQLSILKVVYEENPISSSDISEHVDSSDRTVKKKWKKLKKDKLIEVKKGEGAVTTPRCMQFVDILKNDVHDLHVFTCETGDGGGAGNSDMEENNQGDPPTPSETEDESVKNVKQKEEDSGENEENSVIFDKDPEIGEEIEKKTAVKMLDVFHEGGEMKKKEAHKQIGSEISEFDKKISDLKALNYLSYDQHTHQYRLSDEGKGFLNTKALNS